VAFLIATDIKEPTGQSCKKGQVWCSWFM